MSCSRSLATEHGQTAAYGVQLHSFPAFPPPQVALPACLSVVICMSGLPSLQSSSRMADDAHGTSCRPRAFAYHSGEILASSLFRSGSHLVGDVTQLHRQKCLSSVEGSEEGEATPDLQAPPGPTSGPAQTASPTWAFIKMTKACDVEKNSRSHVHPVLRHFGEVTSVGLCQHFSLQWTRELSPHKVPAECVSVTFHEPPLLSLLTVSTEMFPCLQAKSTVFVVFHSAATNCTGKVPYCYQSDFRKRLCIPGSVGSSFWLLSLGGKSPYSAKPSYCF